MSLHEMDEAFVRKYCRDRDWHYLSHEVYTSMYSEAREIKIAVRDTDYFEVSVWRHVTPLSTVLARIVANAERRTYDTTSDGWCKMWMDQGKVKLLRIWRGDANAANGHRAGIRVYSGY